MAEFERARRRSAVAAAAAVARPVALPVLGDAWSDVRSFKLPAQAAVDRLPARPADTTDGRARRAAAGRTCPAARRRARPVAVTAAARAPRARDRRTLVLRDLARAETRIEAVTSTSLRAAPAGYTVARHGARDGATCATSPRTESALRTGLGNYNQFASTRPAPGGLRVGRLGGSNGACALRALPAARDAAPPPSSPPTLAARWCPTRRARVRAERRRVHFGVARRRSLEPADSLADKALFYRWHYQDHGCIAAIVEAGRDPPLYRPRLAVGPNRLVRSRATRCERPLTDASHRLALTDVPYALESLCGEAGATCGSRLGARPPLVAASRLRPQLSPAPVRRLSTAPCWSHAVRPRARLT